MKSFKAFFEENEKLKPKYHYFTIIPKEGSTIPNIDKINRRNVSSFGGAKTGVHQTFGMYDTDPDKVKNMLTSHLETKHGMKEGEHYTMKKWGS